MKDTQEKLWDGSFRVTRLGRHDGESFLLPVPIEYNARCLRLGCDKATDWQDKADKWCITIGKESFDYYTGTGLRKNNKPVKPQLSGVLSSLLLDSEACTMSFNEWVDNFGYDNDSIKARKTYDDCQVIGDRLARTGICVDDQLREFMADY